MSAIALLRGCVGIPLVLLSGCHARTSDHPLAPLTAVAASSTSFTVPQDPVYEQAVGQFRRHDVSEALAGINTLLAKPQYAQNSTDRVFLLRQRAICRHAIDPHVSADDRSVSPPLASPPPVHPAPVPLTIAQADCGPRALVLVCAALHQPASLPALRSAAGTTAQGTTLAAVALATLAVVTPAGIQVGAMVMVFLAASQEGAEED